MLPTNTHDPALARRAPEVRAFAAQRLGPAAGAHLARPAALRAACARRDAGLNLEDAVLAELHAALPASRALADDFAAYLLHDLFSTGSDSMANTSRLRRFLDTGDLVLSVFGDQWHDVPSIRFESAEQFRSVVARRLHGRTASAARRLPAAGGAEHAGGPVPGTIPEEERARLILALLRLQDGERDLLRLHLKGLPLPDFARRLGVDADAARRTLAGAIARARRLALAHETCTADASA
jgi:hypothetical protein